MNFENLLNGANNASQSKDEDVLNEILHSRTLVVCLCLLVIVLIFALPWIVTWLPWLSPFNDPVKLGSIYQILCALFAGGAFVLFHANMVVQREQSRKQTKILENQFQHIAGTDREMKERNRCLELQNWENSFHSLVRDFLDVKKSISIDRKKWNDNKKMFEEVSPKKVYKGVRAFAKISEDIRHLYDDENNGVSINERGLNKEDIKRNLSLDKHVLSAWAGAYYMCFQKIDEIIMDESEKFNKEDKLFEERKKLLKKSCESFLCAILNKDERIVLYWCYASYKKLKMALFGTALQRISSSGVFEYDVHISNTPTGKPKYGKINQMFSNERLCQDLEMNHSSVKKRNSATRSHSRKQKSLTNNF